ncbi:hypothetical protein [uncultured Chryseobacterium sp.]|uniref:hypothetical protein n=1 Tax=uncultured Chryseobacterium sp. TaxID=259322 RepID=UPI002601020A|nr:hypothetical protein [uncultured Chryseobacterium sp.]
MKLFISVLLLFYASSAGAQTAAFISKEKLYPALKGYSAKQASLDTLKVKSPAGRTGPAKEISGYHKSVCHRAE